MADPEPLTVEQQIGVLTATVDQLQAERDRDAFAITFLMLATCALAGLLLMQHLAGRGVEVE